jgi:hypothetical protein
MDLPKPGVYSGFEFRDLDRDPLNALTDHPRSVERLSLPKISEFFGISIYVYYDDHPPPHFHAVYSGAEAVILIDHLRVTRDELPPRVFGLVLEWAFQHRLELGKVWLQAQALEPLSRIPPLE